MSAKLKSTELGPNVRRAIAVAEQARRDAALTAYLCRLIEPDLAAFARLDEPAMAANLKAA